MLVNFKSYYKIVASQADKANQIKIKFNSSMFCKEWLQTKQEFKQTCNEVFLRPGHRSVSSLSG